MAQNLAMTISDLSLLMGVSQQAIRMYEKKGALPHAKDEANGYRYYHYPDLQQGIQLRNYVKLGIPISQAAKLVSGIKPEEIDAALAQQEQELLARMEREQALIRAIERQRRWLADIPALCDRCVIEERPPLYRLTCTANGKALQDAHARKIINEWTALLPVTMLSGIVEEGEMGPDCVVSPGLAIFAGECGLLSTVNSPYITYFHPRRCVKTILRIGSKARDFYSMGVSALEYMEKKGLRLTGEAVSVSIVNKALASPSPDDPSDYVLSWLPID